MSTQLCAAVDELRNWTRFCKERGEHFAVICKPSCEEVLAEVHDESLAGISLVLEDLTEFDIGREAELVYAGDYIRGRVRHIELMDDHKFVVGFACERIIPPR